MLCKYLTSVESDKTKKHQSIDLFEDSLCEIERRPGNILICPLQILLELFQTWQKIKIGNLLDVTCEIQMQSMTPNPITYFMKSYVCGHKLLLKKPKCPQGVAPAPYQGSWRSSGPLPLQAFDNLKVSSLNFIRTTYLWRPPGKENYQFMTL